MLVTNLDSIKIKIASPEEILSWSKGEVTKPETINYRTQKSEKDGLFCEKIFGPLKDYQCYCGKYKSIKYKGIICDRCGVEVTKSSVRRERMGHIKLASPCSHIWFLKGIPSRIGMILDLPMQQAERVIYFSAYIITKVNNELKRQTIDDVEKEYKAKIKIKKSLKNKTILKDLKELKEIRNKIKEEVLSIKPLRILSEIEYRNLSLKYGDIFEASTGAEGLREIFKKLDLNKIAESLKKQEKTVALGQKRKITKRLEIIQAMLKSKIRPEWMFLTVLPVLPADLRPMVQLDGGRYASSDLNDLYRRVINRNNRLKYLLEISAPEVIIRNEKRMLQEAVDALIDNRMRLGTTTKATTGGRRLLKSLADMLAGKQGRFRQNLLGKRVDYSGRSVIVVGPELKLSQCGLPKRMALELFKPFVIKKILEKELAYNVRGAGHLIEEETDEVWAILEEVVKNKLILLNRAPTLHKLSIQGFYPVLIEGRSIRVHPLICKAFNADFDGDQMPVHLPLSDEAQLEAKEIMLSTSNLLKPATGLPIASPTKDIVLGCYWLTTLEKEGDTLKIFSSPEEAHLAYDLNHIGLRKKIKVRVDSDILETSVGRLLFNQTLPEDFPFQNEKMDSKKMNEIIKEVIRIYNKEICEITLDKIKQLGFEYSTKSGISWGMDDLIVPKEKENLIKEAEKEIVIIKDHYRKGLLSEEEKSSKTIEVWQRVRSKIEKLVPKTLPSDGSVFSIVSSGSRGTWAQPIQMCGMKGLVSNPAGQIIELPIKSSFKEGLDVLEYFISTHGARKGVADTALRTSTAGYLTRRLVDVTHELIITEKDCHDKKGMEIKRIDAEEIGQNFVFKIVGRISLEDIKSKNKILVKKGEIINFEKANLIKKQGIEKVRVRSPLTCKTKRGICQKCYGWDLAHNQPIKLGEAVGIVAAQSIGEPGVQLTLRTFHTGGVVGEADITRGLPRVEEVFEARAPKGEAVMSLSKGKVIEIDENKNIIKVRTMNRKAVQNLDSLRKLKEERKQKTKKNNIYEYKIPSGVAILVEPGQEIEEGKPLCEGNLDLKKLFKAVGPVQTQHHIIKEIQKIYVSQGATIHDKHIELVVRQMFSRMYIKEPGDSLFNQGEIVEKSRLLDENERLKKAKKRPAEASQLILGVSRVALTTDSWLSAASFQETSRILTKAAIEGKEDKLLGLKENVIIGKLIPAGTGFKELGR